MTKPVISIIMGSKSDWATMQKPLKSSTTSVLLTKRKLFPRIAHRTSCSNMPKKHVAVASRSSSQVRVAQLTCQVWSQLKRPFQLSGYLSNPRALSGVDSLYSIVQMPGGVPVATMAIGEAGATNAALFALRLLSVEDQAIATALADFAEEQGKIAEESTNELN